MALKYLNRSRKTDTRKMAIGGGNNYPVDLLAQEKWVDSLVVQTGLSRERVAQLFERYGTRATQIAKHISKKADSPLKFLKDFSQREIEFIAKNEKIIHLDDFLLRRSMMAKLGLISQSNMDEIAEMISQVLKWSDEQRKQEIQRTRYLLDDKHGVDLESSKLKENK